jgi:hypothetical protein
MQLLVIAMIIPWLMLLSKTAVYKWVQITGAGLAGIAALAWIIQRSTGKANFVTDFVEAAAKYGVWCIAALAIASLAIYFSIVFMRRNAGLVSRII